ncbi:MAG TPA: hypothetical protein VI855_06970 [Dehalococcoidia bacterium]|nr:hypothetical protein [Dehalococcoidia bacterium]
MRRWYVKSVEQSLADTQARAALLDCEAVLEHTSSQVNPLNPRPHVIVQTRRGVNHVFLEPTTLAALGAINDEPETPAEAAAHAVEALREAARGRLMAYNPQAILDPNARTIISDILIHLGLRP